MEPSYPLVSVIVPAYNAAAFIGQTLNSVLSQTYAHLEVLVVDDGSQDRTADIVRTVAERDRRITLFQQSNRGVAAARNLAIRHAHGDFVAPIDADDFWYPEKTAKQVRCLTEAGPEVALVYTWSVSIDDQSPSLSACAHTDLRGSVFRALLFRNFVGNASVPLIRRSCLEQAGGYADFRATDACGCEDWGLLLRIAENYQFTVVPEYLVGYRAVPGSMSSHTRSMARSYEMIMADVKARHPEIPAQLYRWSRSNFYLYLAGVSYGTAEYRYALHLIVRILWLDKATWLSPWVFWVLGMSLMSASLQPMTSWMDPQVSLRKRLRRFLRGQRCPVPSLAGLQENVRRPPTRQRLFNRVMDRRWAQVTANP